MSKRVLIPINDQESSLIALETAMARKWPVDTKFLLCSIVEELTSVDEHFDRKHQQVLAWEQHEHAQEVESWLNLARELFTQVFPETEILMKCGPIPEKICTIAEDWGADYILIGSHSFSLSKKLALRGVAAQVLAVAPCTVEAIRLPHDQEIHTSDHQIDFEKLRKLASQPPNKILIASDLSLQAAQAIDWVIEQDWGHDCQIRLISVFVSERKEPGLAVHEKVSSYRQKNKIQNHLEQELKIQGKKLLAKLPKVKLNCFLAQAESALEGILGQAEDWGADLVITGAQGANRTNESRAGSNAIKIMEHLDCSMIAVRPSERAQVHFSWLNQLPLK